MLLPEENGKSLVHDTLSKVVELNPILIETLYVKEQSA